MHRSIGLFLILFSVKSFSAMNLNAEECSLNSLINGTCGVLNPYYIYTQKYGGREVAITNGYISNENVTTFTPEYGWHNGQNKITWTSSTLLPGNIKKNKVIFGVTGISDSTAYNDCTINLSSSDLTSPNGSDNCYVPSGPNYVYSSYMGGRQNSCSLIQIGSAFQLINTVDATKSNGACWIDTSSNDPNIFNISLKTSGNPNFVIKNTTDTITCPITGPSIGKQNISCTTPDTDVFKGYFYPSVISGDITGSFGGRSKICIYNEANSNSCWIDDPSAYVLNDTSCTEKLPNGSTDTNGALIPNLGEPKNSYSCKTATAGRFVYTNPRGGRNNDCSATSKSGNCYVNAYRKAGLDSDLISGNIKNGIVVFGVRGNLILAEIEYGSGAHKEPSINASPNRISYKVTGAGESDLLELNPNAAPSSIYPSSYNPVPKISSNSEADVVKVDRTLWNNTECGTAGTILTRINNCATTLGATTTKWKGTVVGNAGQANWDLVTRKQDSIDTNITYEVWRDSSTGLLWSSLVSSNLNWCKASGSNGRKTPDTQIYDPATSSEDDPNGYCDIATNQDQTTPVSACAYAAGFSTSYNGISTPGKGGHTSATVSWRLPTIYDYILANHHGLRFVLPDIGVSTDDEWTATTSSSNRKNAWIFSGKTGARQVKQRNYPAAVRCIGR